MNCGRAAAFVIAIDALALGTSTTPGLAHVTVSPATLSAGAEDTMRKLPVPISTDDGEVAAAVATITWSGGRIAPGEYQDFAILAGPIPSGAKTLPFKAVQTYSNGEVVRWIERRGPGEPEPAHPAPVLHVR
jgi:uncharacterized protein YcnI